MERNSRQTSKRTRLLLVPLGSLVVFMKQQSCFLLLHVTIFLFSLLIMLNSGKHLAGAADGR